MDSYEEQNNDNLKSAKERRAQIREALKRKGLIRPDLHHKIHIRIVTPYGLFYDRADCEMGVVPASDGMNAFMAGHVPVVIAVHPGPMRIKRGDSWEECFVSAGYATVQIDSLTVISNAAEWPEDIDIDRAQASIDRNTERLKRFREENNKTGIRQARHSIQRGKERLRVVRRFKERQENEEKMK